MKIKNHIKSIAVITLLALSFSAYCFLEAQSDKQDSNEANLITVPVQENTVPALPDVKILYYIIDQVKGGLVPGQ